MDGDYNDKTNYLFLSEKQNQKKKKKMEEGDGSLRFCF